VIAEISVNKIVSSNVQRHESTSCVVFLGRFVILSNSEYAGGRFLADIVTRWPVFCVQNVDTSVVGSFVPIEDTVGFLQNEDPGTIRRLPRTL